MVAWLEIVSDLDALPVTLEDPRWWRSRDGSKYGPLRISPRIIPAVAEWLKLREAEGFVDATEDLLLNVTIKGANQSYSLEHTHVRLRWDGWLFLCSLDATPAANCREAVLSARVVDGIATMFCESDPPIGPGRGTKAKAMAEALRMYKFAGHLLDQERGIATVVCQRRGRRKGQERHEIFYVRNLAKL